MPYTCAGAGCQLAPNTTYFVVAASLGSAHTPGPPSHPPTSSPKPPSRQTAVGPSAPAITPTTPASGPTGATGTTPASTSPHPHSEADIPVCPSTMPPSWGRHSCLPCSAMWCVLCRRVHPPTPHRATTGGCPYIGRTVAVPFTCPAPPCGAYYVAGSIPPPPTGPPQGVAPTTVILPPWECGHLGRLAGWKPALPEAAPPPTGQPQGVAPTMMLLREGDIPVCLSPPCGAYYVAGSIPPPPTGPPQGVAPTTVILPPWECGHLGRLAGWKPALPEAAPPPTGPPQRVAPTLDERSSSRSP